MTDEEMAEKYAKANMHYEIAKRENGADYAKEVSNVTIKQAFLAGLESKNKENAELKEKLNIRSCQNCRKYNRTCPNDGSCHNFSLWQPFINPELTKAKEIIKEMLSILPKENIEGVYEITEEAEQFIKEMKND